MHLGREDKQDKKSTSHVIYRRTGLCEFIHPPKHMYQAYKIVLTAANVIFQMFTVSFQCINLLIKNTLCVNSEQFLVYHQQKGHLERMYSALTR